MKEKFSKLWKKLINYETIAYLICGVLTTVVNYITEVGCYYGLHMSTLISQAISWCVAVVFAFFVNKIFVFKSKDWSGKKFWFELGTFTAARILSGIFETIFMLITVDMIGAPNWLSKIASNVFVIVMNYFASKLLIFRKKETD